MLFIARDKTSAVDFQHRARRLSLRHIQIALAYFGAGGVVDNIVRDGYRTFLIPAYLALVLRAVEQHVYRFEYGYGK